VALIEEKCHMVIPAMWHFCRESVTGIYNIKGVLPGQSKKQHHFGLLGKMLTSKSALSEWQLNFESG